ncbi:Protein of unknown function [Lactobacillus gigeriorum DSM 23908 = CRBIP 24.85]|uniref:Uncharacterized protein n=1 Tax=Lactobacillus gigeriorum DSM 23908 = CRBIP 24.85 TaxID=1423751 RepID=I7K0T1_9LACO|nr:Protein of unknown function [Lactobacillus gigeriorum DSM 23908 = CRBIP 24.85]
MVSGFELSEAGVVGLSVAGFTGSVGLSGVTEVSVFLYLTVTTAFALSYVTANSGISV